MLPLCYLHVRCLSNGLLRRDEHGPTIGPPLHPSHTQRRRSTLVAIIKMTAKPIRVACRNNPRVSRPNERPLAAEKQTSTAAEHVFAGFVEIRTRNLMASTNPNVVCAVRAPTALSPVHEQIVELAMMINVGRFDGTRMRQRVDRLVVSVPQARRWVERNQFDPAPVGAECEPQSALCILRDGGID